MTQLKQIEKILSEAHVPRDVCIGTNSIADRVQWMALRLAIRDNAATKRLEQLEILKPFALAVCDLLQLMAERGGNNEFVIAGHSFTVEQVQALQEVLGKAESK